MDQVSTHSFKALGRTIEVSGTTPALLAWLDDRWNFPEKANALESNWTFQINQVQSPHANFPDLPAKTLFFNDFPIGIRQSGANHFWVGDKEGGSQINILENLIKIETWGFDSQNRSAGTALFTALIEAMTVSGLVHIHACVAKNPQGQTFAFTAPSGTGKSTTLLSLIKAGWTPVAEDFSWIDPDSLGVFGWDRGISLLEDSKEKLLEWKPNLPYKVLETQKYFFEYQHFGGSNDGTFASIVELSRDSSIPSSSKILSKLQTGLLLWQAASVPLSKKAQEVVSGLVSRVSTASLGAGVTLGNSPVAGVINSLDPFDSRDL